MNKKQRKTLYILGIIFFQMWRLEIAELNIQKVFFPNPNLRTLWLGVPVQQGRWSAFIPIQILLQFMKYLVSVYNTPYKEESSQSLFEIEYQTVRVWKIRSQR